MIALRCLCLPGLCLLTWAALAQTQLPDGDTLELSESTEQSPDDADCTDCESDFAVSILRSRAAGPDQIRIMIAVSNQGPDDASEVALTLEMLIPEGVVLSATDPEPGSSFTEPNWFIEELPVNGSAVLILDFEARSLEEAENLLLTARILSANQAIVNRSDDVATLSSTIGADADGNDESDLSSTPLSLSPEDSDLPGGTQWERYRSVKLVGSGGTPPLRLRLRGAPPGLGYLGLEGTLTLAGTPREAGEFTLVVTLEDGDDPPARLTREYRLEIAEGSAPAPQNLIPTPAPQAPAAPSEAVPVESDATEEQPTDEPGEGTEESATPEAGAETSIIDNGNTGEGLSSLGDDTLGLDSNLSDDLGNTDLGLTDTTASSDDSTEEETPVDDGELVDEGGGGAVGSVSLGFRTTLPEARVGDPFDAEVLVGITEDAELAIARDLLPPGLKIQATSLSGVPAQAGGYAFSLRGQRSGTSLNQGYSIQVIRSSVELPEQTLPTPPVGQPYGARLLAVGGTPPYRWQASDLPPGLVLSQGGLLGGISNTRTEQRISIRLEDASGRRGNGELRLPGAENAPVLQQFSLPPLLHGSDQRFTLPLTGGNPPYRCESRGTLPPGLRLDSDCLLVGRPTIPGVFQLEGTATDSSALALRGEFSLPVTVASRAGIDTSGLPFRFAPTPLHLQVPGNPPSGQFSAQAVDLQGQRTAIGQRDFAGETDLQLVRYTVDGQFAWAERLSLDGDQQASDAVASPLDGSLWVVGTEQTAENQRSFIARFSPLGVFQAPMLYPDTGDSALYGVAADDNGIYAVGMRLVDGQARGTVLALNPDGSLRWESVASTDASIARRVTLVGCQAQDCATVMVGGEIGDSGWLQRLDAATGEVDDAQAVSIAAPVQGLATLGGGSLAVASGVGETPLVIVDANLQRQCRAEPELDTRLPLVEVDSRGFIYLFGERPSSGRVLARVYDSDCERRLELTLDLPPSQLLASALGVDNRVSLVGEIAGRPLVVDLNSGQTF